MRISFSSRLKPSTALVAGLIAAACVVSACSSSGKANSSGSSGSSGKLTTVKVGMLTAGAAGGFINMAQEKGYYKDCGVDLKVIEMSSGAQLSPAVVSGSVDIGIESPQQMLIGVQKGVLHAKVIGSIEDGLPWAIYGGKGITSLKDLEGKTMAVSSSTGLPEIVAQLIFKKNGIDTSTIKWVNAGSNSDYYKAVLNGVTAGASAPSDFIPQAKKDGVHVLATAAQEVPLYPRWTVIGTDKFLSAHPDAATCYLAAMMRGERYAFDHPDEAKALAAKTLGGTTKPTDPIVTDMYQQIVSDKLINRNAEFPVAKLEYQEDALISLGLLKSRLPQDKIFDDKYRQAALKLVGGAQ